MKTLYIIILVLINNLTAFSQKLSPGSFAPQIKTGEVLKGNKTEAFKKGEIYVLEFWATWCGPCKDVIPHISKLAGKYADGVTFIGISVFENDIKKVGSFVNQMGDKMSYNVVTDYQLSDTAKKGFMTENWLRPLGIVGIPATVIIGKTGLIEWVGNPGDLEAVLQRLLKGNWDAGLFIKQQAAMDSVSKMRGKIGANPDWVELHKNISVRFPYISADSSISILKISYFYKDIANLEPILLEFLEKYGKTIPMEDLNSYAWGIFSKSTNQKLIEITTGLFNERLNDLRNGQTVANWYDTYAGLLYKEGRKEDAIGQQMQAYSMFSGEEPMLDITNGSITIGARKADFLITAFKMEKGISIWEKKDLDSINADLKKEDVYWGKLRVRMLLFYSKNKADSLLAFTKLRYYKLNKQWDNYSNAVIEYGEHLGKRTSAAKNSQAWDVFLHSNEKKVLNSASDWMVSLVENKNDPNASSYMDTYANLLYKAGRKKEAISWQQKAVDIASEKRKVGLIATLDKMKRGDATWK